MALKGSGRTLRLSVKFMVSIGAAGSSRMLKAQRSRAVLMKRELESLHARSVRYLVTAAAEWTYLFATY